MAGRCRPRRADTYAEQTGSRQREGVLVGDVIAHEQDLVGPQLAAQAAHRRSLVGRVLRHDVHHRVAVHPTHAGEPVDGRRHGAKRLPVIGRAPVVHAEGAAFVFDLDAGQIGEVGLELSAPPPHPRRWCLSAAVFRSVVPDNGSEWHAGEACGDVGSGPPRHDGYWIELRECDEPPPRGRGQARAVSIDHNRRQRAVEVEDQQSAPRGEPRQLGAAFAAKDVPSHAASSDRESKVRRTR